MFNSGPQDGFQGSAVAPPHIWKLSADWGVESHGRRQGALSDEGTEAGDSKIVNKRIEGLSETSLPLKLSGRRVKNKITARGWGRAPSSLTLPFATDTHRPTRFITTTYTNTTTAHRHHPTLLLSVQTVAVSTTHAHTPGCKNVSPSNSTKGFKGAAPEQERAVRDVAAAVGARFGVPTTKTHI